MRCWSPAARAAANIDPLKHYLQLGIHEGRSLFPDGVWG